VAAYRGFGLLDLTSALPAMLANDPSERRLPRDAVLFITPELFAAGTKEEKF